MYTCTTEGIKISVNTKFEPQHSNWAESRFVFSYHVDIQNKSDFTVQLLKRHWFIMDSNSNYREVHGEGVIGEQPILAPGENHQYKSWCPFSSEIGMMKGYFTMQRDIDGALIEVKVPNFTMCALPKLN